MKMLWKEMYYKKPTRKVSKMYEDHFLIIILLGRFLHEFKGPGKGLHKARQKRRSDVSMSVSSQKHSRLFDKQKKMRNKKSKLGTLYVFFTNNYSQ